jgi:phosphate transport system protein
MIDTNYLDEHMRRDMDLLRAQLRTMADVVLEGLEKSVVALANRDRRLAYTVILADNRIDVLEGHIDRLCQEFLVRHMPVAAQLRFVVAVAKVNSELERMGDYAEAVARRAVTLSTSSAPLPCVDQMVEMSKLAFQMLRQAVDAFLRGDTELALQTLELDAKVNAMNRAIYDELTHPDSAEGELTRRFALLGALNRLERVADRACNVAEEAIYVVRGQVQRHLTRHDQRVLFVCDTNGCRSQMAEGIARHRAPVHFIFSSAGTNPAPIDAGTIAYMQKRGIDISRQRSKGLADVGDLSDYQVVVTLMADVEEQLPPLAYKAVQLNWEINDPSKVEGTATEKEAAYKEVFDELDTKIRELCESLVGHADREAEQ